MSDIVKTVSFCATSYNEHVTIILFSFPAWDHTAHRRILSKKIGKCDGGIWPGL